MADLNNLRAIRTQRGLTQLDLATLTQIAPSNISSMENGKQFAYPGWRKRLAKALGVSEKSILWEVGQNDEKT